MKMKKVKLESLALPEKGAIISGPFGSNISSKFFVERGVPVIRGNNLCLDYSKFNDSGFVFITQEKADELNCWADKEDLLFTAAGTLGQVGVLKEPLNFTRYVISNKQIRVRLDSTKVNTLYAYYWFSSPWMFKRIAGVNKGSTVPLLTLAEIRDLPIFLPENRSTQDAVVEVLESISNKIALNKKMNQKLEAMAKRLYDYWFVQYDFPDKNGHPYKTTGGPMTYNPTLKREIPVGWEVVDINELCQIVDCLHSKKPDFCYEDENSYLLALENITKEGYIDLSDKYYISKKDFAEWTSRICVRENDFLFTNAGRAGDMGMVPEGVLCAIGRNITAVRPEKINPWYLRCFFKSLYMQEQILNNLDQGSFFMSFNVRSIKKLQVLMPSEPLMKKFISFVEPHLKRIEKNNKEISRLTALRDKLLPLLMNGQVVVG